MMCTTAGEWLTGIRPRRSDSASLRRAPLIQDETPGAMVTAGVRASQPLATGPHPARVAGESRTGPAVSPASVQAVGLPHRLPGTAGLVQARAESIGPERPRVAAMAVQTSAPGAVLLLQVAVTVLSIVRTVTAPVPVLPATGARPAARYPDPAEVPEAEVPSQAALAVLVAVPGQAALAVEVAVPGRAVVAEDPLVAVVAAAAVVAGSRPVKPQM